MPDLFSESLQYEFRHFNTSLQHRIACMQRAYHNLLKDKERLERIIHELYRERVREGHGHQASAPSHFPIAAASLSGLVIDNNAAAPPPRSDVGSDGKSELLHRRELTELREAIEQLEGEKAALAADRDRLAAELEASTSQQDALMLHKERSQKRLCHLEKQKKSSINLLDKMFERQREALERAQAAERLTFATKLIQRKHRTFSVRKEEQGKREEAERDQHERELKVAAAKSHVAEAMSRATSFLEDLERKTAETAELDSARMMLRGRDGSAQPLGIWLLKLLQYLLKDGEESASASMAQSKYFSIGNGISALSVGRPEAAALGLASALGMDDTALHELLARGVDAIQAEIEALGDDEALECFEYVFSQPAGSSDRVFDNSPYPRDCDAAGVRADRRHAKTGEPLVLADFVKHPIAQQAELNAAQIVALRLYSTAAFKAINGPLRDGRRRTPHPLAATVANLTEAIKKLRAVDTENKALDLWRGMRNLGTTSKFESHGGSELALMSTTSDPTVAVRYALSGHSLLFKVSATSFMNRGADITWLSAFPAEKEVVYPPLTYLQPTGRREVVTIEAGEAGKGSPRMEFTVLEVEPHV